MVNIAPISASEWLAFALAELHLSFLSSGLYSSFSSFDLPTSIIKPILNLGIQIMTELAPKVADKAAQGPVTTSNTATSDNTATGIVRRSSRVHTGHSSLNVEAIAQSVGLTEPVVQKRKRAPVSKKLPLKDRGISKNARAPLKSAITVAEDDTAPNTPEQSNAGTKRKAKPAKPMAPMKRQKMTPFTEVPDNVLVYVANPSTKLNIVLTRA